MKIIDQDFIDNHIVTNHGGASINESQCIILGTRFSMLKKGWKSRLIGITISNASEELFILLKGVAGKKRQATVISNFKRKHNIT